MFGALFGSLTSKIFGGVSIVLLLATLFYRHEAHKWETAFDKQRIAYTAASAKAEAAAIAAREATEAGYRTKAEESDHAHRIALEGAERASERFISGHRLRACDQRPAGDPVAAPNSGGTGVPESVPADAVVVSAEDVRACTGAVTYAVSAHDWAAGINGR